MVSRCPVPRFQSPRIKLINSDAGGLKFGDWLSSIIHHLPLASVSLTAEQLPCAAAQGMWNSQPCTERLPCFGEVTLKVVYSDNSTRQRLFFLIRATGIPDGNSRSGICWEFRGIRHFKNSPREFPGISELSAGISGNFKNLQI